MVVLPLLEGAGEARFGGESNAQHVCAEPAETGMRFPKFKLSPREDVGECQILRQFLSRERIMTGRVIHGRFRRARDSA